MPFKTQRKKTQLSDVQIKTLGLILHLHEVDLCLSPARAERPLTGGVSVIPSSPYKGLEEDRATCQVSLAKRINFRFN